MINPALRQRRAGLQEANPARFAYRKTKWGKFEDSGMDNIELGG